MAEMNVLDAAEMECSCGGKATKTRLELDGFSVSGWKCSKCGEVYLDPRDVNPILKLKKLASEQMLSSKVGKVGNSLVLRIPKELADLYGIKKGRILKLVPENKNEIKVVVG